MRTTPATTGELAIHVLTQHAAIFLELAPDARSGHDPRAVHQMRVAARRLRAALRLFADLLPFPEASHLNRELQWIASQLGHVRDLDVQLRRHDEIAAELRLEDALAPFRAWLTEDQRRPAQAILEDALRSARYVELVQALRRAETWSPAIDARLADDAPRRLERAFKALASRAGRLDDDSPTGDFHQVRIRAKRLRYATEFFAPVYGKPAERLVKRLTALQDLLGDLQDGVVGEQRVHAVMEAAGAAWPADTLLALGQVLQLNAQRATQIRRAFRKAYADVTGKTWRRLESKVTIS
jgi:triphosphatase